MQLGKAPVSVRQSSTVLSLPSLVVIAHGVVGWLEEGGMVFKGRERHHSSSLASCHVGLWGTVEEGERGREREREGEREREEYIILVTALPSSSCRVRMMERERIIVR